MIKLIVSLYFVLFSTLLYSAGNPPFIDNAIKIEMTEAGFGIIGGILEERFSTDISDFPIEDIDLSLPLVANIKTKGLSFSAAFAKIDVKPLDGGVELDILIKDFTIKIKELRFENFFMPWIGSSCFNTEIGFGNNNSLPLNGKIGISVKNGKMKLSHRSLKFDLDPNQYVSQGPLSCKGLFGVKDYIAQFALKTILKNARPFINAGVKLLAKPLLNNIGPFLAKQIEKVRIPIGLPDLFVIPPMEIFFKARPINMEFRKDGMYADISLAVGKSEDKSLEASEPMLLKYFTIKMKENFINELFTVLIPGETPKIEINADLHEMLGDLLLASELSAILPDLETAQMDTDRIKLYISIKETPKLEIGDDGNIIVIVPSTAADIQIKRDGKWIDYFTMIIDMKLSIKIDVSERLSIEIDPQRFEITGKWASEYTPSDSQFYADDTEDVLKQLLEMITSEEGGILGENLPTIPIGGHFLSIKNVLVEKPYISLDVMQAPEDLR